MKQLALSLLAWLTVSGAMWAQDDVYFVPSKKAYHHQPTQRSQVDRAQSADAANAAEYDDWAEGRASWCDVDEYNRQKRNAKRRSCCTDSIDMDNTAQQTATGRIVRFRSPRAVIVASPFYDDYFYDLAYYDPWFSNWGWSSWHGFYDPFYSPWTWRSPWAYSAWYSPWYSGWGWGFGWHSGWGWDPWFSPYWGGWGYPYRDYARYVVPRGNYYGNVRGANYASRGGNFSTRSNSYTSRGNTFRSNDGYMNNYRSSSRYSAPSRNDGSTYSVRGNRVNTSRNGGVYQGESNRSSRSYSPTERNIEPRFNSAPSRSNDSYNSGSRGGSFSTGGSFGGSRGTFSGGGGFSGGGSSRGNMVGGRR